MIVLDYDDNNDDNISDKDTVPFPVFVFCLSVGFLVKKLVHDEDLLGVD